METKVWYYLFGILFLGLVGTVIYIRRNKKRYPNHSQADLAMWNVYATTLVLGITLFVMRFFVPLGVLEPREFKPGDTAETKIETLLENDKRAYERTKGLVELVDILCMLLGFYLMGISTQVATIQRQRNLELDPELKKPLGLGE